MKIAFLILAHKSPKQVKRLISVLLHENCKVFLHIDSKTDVNAFKKIINELNNQNIIYTKSHDARWSTISVTEARLELLQAAVSDPLWEPDYFVMLSGQTYPIKPMSDFISFLENNKGVSFIEHYPLPCDLLGENSGMDRISCYSYSIGKSLITYFPRNFTTSFNIRGRIINNFLRLYHLFKPKRNFPSYIKPFYGIDWWVVTRDAVDYILEYIKLHPDYHKYHKHTRQTCEIYFPSILAGSEYNGEIVNNSLHFMLWKPEDSGHPEDLTEKHFDQLLQSKAFFARKFDMTDDILNRIEAEMLKKK